MQRKTTEYMKLMWIYGYDMDVKLDK